MSNRIRSCKFCKTKKRANEGIQTPISWFCCTDCAYKEAQKLQKKSRERQIAKAKKVQAEKEKEAARAHRERKKAVKKLSWWQDRLQKLVNQFVMKVLKVGQPCRSCGNPNPTEAGHFLSRGAHPNKRYLINNIFPQCHECNVYKSGNAGEYEKALIGSFGIEFVESIKAYDIPLKEQFPHWSDYEAEIVRYRKLLRENGVKPII